MEVKSILYTDKFTPKPKTLRKLSLDELKEEEVASLQLRYGKNVFATERKSSLLRSVVDIAKEPMFIMLTVACLLYFLLGEPQEGALMFAAMIFVAAISLYQEVKSSHALEALKKYTEPKVIVVRSGKEKMISTEELVPGDVILLEEGSLIPADATVIESNDLTVNESIITGESLPVMKSVNEDEQSLYQGTTINSGKCYARVKAIGSGTMLGTLGKSLSAISTSKTLLQRQIGRFVKIMALVGLVFFTLIWLLNYVRSQEVMTSLLLALTLAMAIVPEEIPVAFSSFMALGAFRMTKLGIITRNPLTIENLGAVSVVCLDKTGTITENKMQVRLLYDAGLELLEEVKEYQPLKDFEVLRLVRLASEADPFDSMEKAIVYAYDQHKEINERMPEMIFEYPLSGQPPMMTHVYQMNTGKMAVAKGAPERIVAVCDLNENESVKIHALVKHLAGKGYRVLGVCSADFRKENYPVDQNDFDWVFRGLVALYDPPKAEVRKEFERWYNAGITIKLVTGDYKETAVNIGHQVGMKIEGRAINGDEVFKLSEEELQEEAQNHSVFARMFPEAKLRLVEALKARGEIVAMMGDGVNDGPALKSSHIGIAMGNKGTEIARQAADLILTDDDLSKVTQAIEQGRKIYHNLKKAIRYIISIHVPIILTASLPLFLGWTYPNIFTPIHVIFLELIMGPTCSIFYEQEPVERGMMNHPPRKRTYSMFSSKEFLFSIVQGLVIATGVLGLYYVFMKNGYDITYVRAMVFLTIICANISLTFINRSFEEFFFKTIHFKNYLAKYVLIVSLVFLALVTLVPAVRSLFQLAAIKPRDFLLCLGVSLLITFWVEGYKLLRSKVVYSPSSPQ